MKVKKIYFVLGIIVLFISLILLYIWNRELLKKILALINKDSISLMKDIVNILFFFVTGYVGFSTYLKAKDTILQPIRTEVFKLQIKLFEQIMEIFNGKGEMDIIKFLHMDELIFVNICSLYDDYARLFFEIKIPIEKRPYNDVNCPLKMVSLDCLEECNDPIKNSYEEDNYVIQTSKESKWKEYKTHIIYLPKGHSEALEIINKILKSPVLPKEAVTKLELLINTISENRMVIKELLNEISQELPQIYPTKDDLIKCNFAWIENRINDKIKPYEEITNELTDYLRKYLMVDNLL